MRRQRQRKTKSDITPPSNRASRAVRHRKGRGGGHSGGLKDLETGQVTSRAVPVPGPTADPGTQAATADQAAMADPGTQAATADQAAMADPGIPAAMADPGIPAATADQAAMADPGILAAMADQAATEGRELRRPWRSGVLGRPWRSGVLGWPWRVAPPKIFLGKLPIPGGAQEPWKASWTGPAEGKVSWTGPRRPR